jgi:membrane protein insertase Oxa1/YidC/SpoIIIJ
MCVSPSYRVYLLTQQTIMNYSEINLKPEHMKWVRVGIDVSWIMPLVLLKLPAGLVIYFITTGLFSTLQTMLFTIPRVRSALGMLPRSAQPVVIPSSREAWRDAVSFIRGQADDVKRQAELAQTTKKGRP